MEEANDRAGPSSPLSSASNHAGPSIQIPPGMSKNAAKKLARKQKLESTKHERRAAERLKKKENKRARFLAAQSSSSTQEGESSVLSAGSGSANKRRRSEKEDGGAGAGEKEYFNARLVIDCGFDELMMEKESSSMTQQLMYLYSANRNAKLPFGEVILTGQDKMGHCLKDVHPEHLPFVPDSTSSIDDLAGNSEGGSIENNRIGQAMDGKLRGVWRRWKRVTIYKHGGLESLLSQSNSEAESRANDAEDQQSITTRHFPPESNRQALHRIPISSAIYLTADTDDTLETLEPGKTYIIGGIVDKNRYKGLCRAKADRLGIRAAKLPLSQEMLEKVEKNVRAQGESISEDAGEADEGEGKGFVGRKVLTVNQVVEILTAWTETRDWVKALEKSLPRRKLKQKGPMAKTMIGTERNQSQGKGAEEEDVDEDEDAARNAQTPLEAS